MSGERQKKGLWLDPRAKLFLILICVLASMFAPSLAYQFALVVLIAILGTFFGKWKYVIKAVCFYAVICVLTVWIMAEITSLNRMTAERLTTPTSGAKRAYPKKKITCRMCRMKASLKHGLHNIKNPTMSSSMILKNAKKQAQPSMNG